MTDQEGSRRAAEESPIDAPPPFAALVPDPLVESLVPDPSQPPPPTVTLAGLLGRRATGASTLAAPLSATRSSKERTC
jgi:hypothetical protein